MASSLGGWEDVRSRAAIYLRGLRLNRSDDPVGYPDLFVRLNPLPPSGSQDQEHKRLVHPVLPQPPAAQ